MRIQIASICASLKCMIIIRWPTSAMQKKIFQFNKKVSDAIKHLAMQKKIIDTK